MFDNLIVSNPSLKASRGVPGTMWSVVIHSALIYGAIVATMKADEIIDEIVQDTTVVFLTDQEEPEPEPEPDTPPPPQIATLNPPPKGFQTITAPVDIPTDIPPIDLSERFDPRDFSGVGVEGGVFSGVEGGTGPVDLTQTFSESAVDEPPARVSGPDLRYPELLRQAGIEGVVVLEYVIDTSGRAEEGSIKVMSSTNAQFEKPAIDVIARSRFRPGRVRGQAVRVLVNQNVQFRITREEDE